MHICRNTLLPSLLFVLLPAAQAQEAHTLFSGTLRTVDASFQSEHLAPAEERMRIVHLLPTAADGAIDLSIPLHIGLFDDVSYPLQLERDTRPCMAGLQVWRGRVADDRFGHLPHYRNTVFVLNTVTGRLVANIETDRGFFQVLPTANAGEYRVRECLPFGNDRCAVADAVPPGRGGSGGALSGCDSTCNETDADGRHVVDVFAGYSNSAAVVAGDLEAHAQANLETVNMGLANSLVGEVYLRLVGIGTTPNNPGIVTSVLDDAWTWFDAGIEATAPDLIAVFQTPTNAPGSAGGWGYMPGRASVNGVAWPTVFRHEVGHNAGGGHCFPDNDNHRNGYDNGHWRTHLCGNDVNFYSTPLVNDDQGNPIGHAEQADMARTWREGAFTMASYAMHRIPYYEGDDCAGLTCLPSHWGDPIEHIQHVQLNTLDHFQTDPGWNCPAVTGYSDHTGHSTELEQGALYTLFVASTVSWEETTMRAWIDWNADGILAAAEQVMDLAGNGPWTVAVNVPEDAALGPVRLRIRQQYGTEYNAGPCNGSGYSSGETEDYTVVVVPAINTGVGMGVGQGAAGLVIHPNPATGTIELRAHGLLTGETHVVLLDASGREVYAQQHQVSGGLERLVADVSPLAPGAYVCIVRQGNSVVRVGRLVKE